MNSINLYEAIIERFWKLSTLELRRELCKLQFVNVSQLLSFKNLNLV